MAVRLSTTSTKLIAHRKMKFNDVPSNLMAGKCLMKFSSSKNLGQLNVCGRDRSFFIFLFRKQMHGNNIIV